MEWRRLPLVIAFVMQTSAIAHLATAEEPKCDCRTDDSVQAATVESLDAFGEKADHLAVIFQRQAAIYKIRRSDACFNRWFSLLSESLELDQPVRFASRAGYQEITCVERGAPEEKNSKTRSRHPFLNNRGMPD